LAPRPIEQGVNAEDTKIVLFQLPGTATKRRLLSAYTGDPGALPPQEVSHGFDFTGSTTEVGITLVQRFGNIIQVPQGIRFSTHNNESYVEQSTNLISICEGLREVIARIQKHDPHFRARLVKHVKKNRTQRLKR